MVDAGGEVDLGWLERIVCGEMDGQEEDAARVWGLALLRASSALWPEQLETAAIQERFCCQCAPVIVEMRRRDTYRTHDGSLPVELYQTEISSS